MAVQQGDEFRDGGVDVVAGALDEPVGIEQQGRARRECALVLGAVGRSEVLVQEDVVLREEGEVGVGGAQERRWVSGVGPGQPPSRTVVEGVEAGVDQRAAGLDGQDGGCRFEGGDSGGGAGGGWPRAACLSMLRTWPITVAACMWWPVISPTVIMREAGPPDGADGADGR